MNTKRIVLIGLLAGMLGIAVSSRAEDIDIYSGLGSNTNVPNIMVVVDNPSSQNNNVGPCTYWDGTSPSEGSKAVGNDQCALVNIVHNMTKRADGSALFKLGLTTMDGVILKLTPVDDYTYTGPATVTLASISYTVPSGSTNRQAIIIAVKALNASPGKSGQGTELQETWAYYTGGNGIYGGVNTATGLLSGLTYSGTNATSGCQKNYIIYLSSVKAGASHAQDNGELPVLDAAANNAKNNNIITATQLKALDPSASGYTGAIPSKPEAGYGIEWARFMNNVDANTGSDGLQTIITYSVATGDTAVPPAAITNTMERYIQDVATYGGGKYFPAGNSIDSLQNDILKILNEVQAVNSVFSSSSLPISVNAQGTFLNQIYMGMFRPDAGAMPRWAGNLKQYQFVLDSTTDTLSLGDSLGNGAISSGGTGFISPNAISFWTCTNLTTSPYPNGYLTATPPNLTAAQIALLVKNNQGCPDPVGGFWVNDASSANAVALGFDLPDGERVERGGAAQQIRHTTLTTNYTTSPAAPRKLYTWCPSGSGCVSDLTNSANVFASNNGGLVATAFGSTLTVNIASLTRAGTTVTVATSGNHGFTSGDSITIGNASPYDYNGTYNITVTDNTHFTYSITELPPVTATGSYTASLIGATTSVSSLVRSGNTVTVTTAAAHGFFNGTTVLIHGATPSDYNGSFVITSVPSATTFTYTLNERPATVAGGGTAVSITKATGSGCPCSTTVAVNAWNAATPGVQRTLGSTTVTVHTGTNISTGSNTFKVGNTVTLTGILDSNGAPVAEYNGAFIITSVSNPDNYSFTFSTTRSPTTPASGSITTAPSIPVNISLTRTGSTATAQSIAVLPAGFITGANVVIGGTQGPNESAYIGSYTITYVDSTHFTYPITTTPITPATGVSGVTMTATRSSGLSAANLGDLIDWVRGKDNQGDESGPGGTVTVRPSVHGDVLHSRPTVINYGSYSIAITATSDSGTIRTATTADTTTIVSSGVTPVVTFANGRACPVTVTSSTTFTYQNTNCGAEGAQTVSVGSKVVVFYGDNGGVFHAVNGNQTAIFGSTGPGDEMWGFIPKEFFIKLNRLRTNSPQLNLPSTPPGILPPPKSKDYFIDGSTGVYQLINSSGSTSKAVLYLTMRRGGNFIYALDVTNPATPAVLWKVDNTSTGMGELGQTWSQPKVAMVKGYCGGSACSSGNPPTPVLIFGGGYDSHEDDEPPVANTSGRAIFVLDALTGTVVWSATHSGGSSSCTAGPPANCVVSDMSYGIPADITLLDRNLDGYIDRLYAADVGGNIWRVDLEPAGYSTPDNWRVHQLAALGCWTGACPIPTGTTQRKFFYGPEVITATNTSLYDAVIAGPGDREHPLYINTSTQRYNRIVLLKDMYTGNDASGMTTPITFGGSNSLFDATTAPWDGTLNGYYITLDAGEKVVNAPLVTAGYVYMGTNQPSASNANSCIANLGTAKGYRISPFSGAYESVVFSGGGLPPSPVSGVVGIVVGGVVKLMPFLIGGGNPDCVGADCASALGGQKPPIKVSTKRNRTYWYIENQ